MRIKVYDSNSILWQSLILLMFILINVLIWVVVIWNGISLSNLIFAISVLSISVAIFSLLLKTADVSIENGKFLIRTIFKSRSKDFQEFKKISELPPFGFYLEFEGNYKVYVMFLHNDLVRQLIDSKSNKIIDSIAEVIDREIELTK